MADGTSTLAAAGEPATAPRRSAAEELVHAIKSGLHEGRIVPGQRLIEPDLVAAFGISRNSVREGLQRLAAEGVVEIERFRGARVRKLSREDVLELNLIREVLEGAAARAAARRIDEDGRARLIRLEEEWDRTAAATPASEVRGRLYSGYNQAFHDLVIALSAQRHLRAFIDQTQLALMRLEFTTLLAEPAEIARSREQHRLIARAILGGDEADAERRMRAHIRSSTEKILSAPASYFL
jgi:DNA-binding GntR family transcriptional regulator